MRLCKTMAPVLLLAAPIFLQAQTESVRLGGELRLRLEAERPAPADTFDAFTLLRARLALDAALAPNARVFLQVQDARVFGEETSTADATADRFDLHQGFLELTRRIGGSDLQIRAGRQEIALGNERLVGAVGWSNTGRSFDAARFTLTPARNWNVTAFAATVRERGRRNAATATERDDHLLLGSYLDTKRVDGWALFDRSDAYRGYTGADRTTLGGRLDLPALGGFTAWAEGSYQLGNQVDPAGVPQDIGAYMYGARVTYGFKSTTLRSVYAGIDHLSGDDTPGDDEYAAFNTLYHTGHKWYGYLDLFLDPAARTGERGLVDMMAGVTLGLAKDSPLSVDLHAFSTASPRTDDEADALGWEADVTLPLSLGPGQRLQLGYSLFRNGEAAPLIALGREDAVWHWGYAMVTFAFGR